jgi:hypothetical protein
VCDGDGGVVHVVLVRLREFLLLAPIQPFSRFSFSAWEAMGEIWQEHPSSHQTIKSLDLRFDHDARRKPYVQ